MTKPTTMEQHIALREAHEIKAESDYFNARPEITNDGRATMLFEAGFRRGFDAASEVYAAPSQPAEPSGWIACSERMPPLTNDMSDDVLGWITEYVGARPSAYVTHLRKGGRGDLTTLYWDVPDGVKVTHWMPLPKGPQR